MLCGRGRKRKSLDFFNEDQENLLRMDNGDYVCMQRKGNRHHKRQLLAQAPLPQHRHYAPVPRCDEHYDEYPERQSKPKGFLKNRGQLHLSIYVNCGLLTVHVIQASHLSVGQNGEPCSAYVKIRLSPDHSKRSRCKTEVIKNTCNPVFDEKFSFELLDEDLRKRILISVWNKQKDDEHSEFLGCMSFGIQPILSHKKTVNGWYYLLTEDLGKRKHLQAAARTDYRSPTRPAPDQDNRHRSPDQRERLARGLGRQCDAGRHGRCSPVRRTAAQHGGDCYPTEACHFVSPLSAGAYSFDSPLPGSPRRPADDFLRCSPITPNASPLREESNVVPNNSPLSSAPMTPSKPVYHQSPSDHPRPSTPGKETRQTNSTDVTVDSEPVYAEVTSTPTGIAKDLVTLEPHVFVIKRGDYGYGFSITGACPVRVSRVDPGSPAESVGLQRDDLIVHINGTDVIKANADSVARIIKSSERKIIMEVERLVRTLPPGQEDTPKFSDSHPQVSTPEYTPLIVRNRGIPPAQGTTQPHNAEGKTNRKALKSIGICAALPMRRVRFFDDET